MLEKLIGKRWKIWIGSDASSSSRRRGASRRSKLIAEGGVPAPSNSAAGPSLSERRASETAPGPDGAPVARA